MQDQAASISKELPKRPGVKIIRAAEESAWRDGYRFLAEAEDAYAAERTRGYADGLAAARQQASKLVIETAERVDRYLASIDKEVAVLAFDIVRRVLSEFDDAELVGRAAKAALADFREAKSVRVRIHPSAEAQARKTLADHLGAQLRQVPNVALELDQELDKQSCILSTEFAVVEATIETQLAAIAQAMGLQLGDAAE